MGNHVEERASLGELGDGRERAEVEAHEARSRELGDGEQQPLEHVAPGLVEALPRGVTAEGSEDARGARPQGDEPGVGHAEQVLRVHRGDEVRRLGARRQHVERQPQVVGHRLHGPGERAGVGRVVAAHHGQLVGHARRSLREDGALVVGERRHGGLEHPIGVLMEGHEQQVGDALGHEADVAEGGPGQQARLLLDRERSEQPPGPVEIGDAHLFEATVPEAQQVLLERGGELPPGSLQHHARVLDVSGVKEVEQRADGPDHGIVERYDDHELIVGARDPLLGLLVEGRVAFVEVAPVDHPPRLQHGQRRVLDVDLLKERDGLLLGDLVQQRGPVDEPLQIELIAAPGVEVDHPLNLVGRGMLDDHERVGVAQPAREVQQILGRQRLDQRARFVDRQARDLAHDVIGAHEAPAARLDRMHSTPADGSAIYPRGTACVNRASFFFVDTPSASVIVRLRLGACSSVG